MSIKPQSTFLASLLVMVGLIFFAFPAMAQHHDHDEGDEHGHSKATTTEHHESAAGHSHELAEVHGGAVQMTKEFHFETVFTDRGVRVYAYDMKQKPIRSKAMHGTVVVSRKGGDKPVSHPLAWTAPPKEPVEAARSDGASHQVDSLGFLFAEYDFTSVADGDAKVDVTVKNLPGKKEKEASYRETFALTPLFGMACAMHPNQASLTAGKCSICGGMDYQPSAVVYGCSMCPEIKATHPGKCPKCGMELTLRAVESKDDDDADSTHAAHHH